MMPSLSIGTVLTEFCDLLVWFQSVSIRTLLVNLLPVRTVLVTYCKVLPVARYD